MTRIRLLTLVALLLIPRAELPAADEARPNVLFIAVDDLRPQLACYGHEEMITPNFDALARNFSHSGTAAVGGDLGWVRRGQIDEQLYEAGGFVRFGDFF